MDSEHLAAQLAAMDYKIVFDSDRTDADVVVINTCGFIGDAKEESDDAKGKYQGTCTVSYCFEDPIRNHRNLYIPAYTARGGGVVVLDVQLNRDGAVTSVRVASSTNTSLNSVAINAARNARTRFNINGDAPSPQKGTITYTFIAQ